MRKPHIRPDEYEAAWKAANMTPEEFGALLAVATSPVNLDSCEQQAERNSARVRIACYPHGYRILRANDRD